MGSTLCWTCIKMSSQTNSVEKESLTGQWTQEVSYNILKFDVVCNPIVVDAKGFPYPLDEPYKVDPDTGYPTPEV